MISSIGAPSMSLDRDKERIDAMRTRNVARTNRFLDARLRTIGLDTDALDQQMRDRRAREEKEKMAAANEFNRNENVYQQVALQEAEDKRLRDDEFARLRREWLDQMELKASKKLEEKELVLSGVDRDACGYSAVQKMAGEDLDKHARKLRQQQQMRAWSEQQSKEIRERKDAEGAEMATYWAYLERVNEKQAELSEEEQAVRKALNLAVKEENRRLAEEKAEDVSRSKERDEKANAEELRFRENFLNEEEDREANGQRNSRQHFKGFTRKQIAELFQSNADMQAERLRMDEKHRGDDAEWYLQQEKLWVLMEQQDQAEQRRMKEAQAKILKDLREQQLQSQERGMKDRDSRFGEIDFTHGMYAGFGKSCR